MKKLTETWRQQKTTRTREHSFKATQSQQQDDVSKKSQGDAGARLGKAVASATLKSCGNKKRLGQHIHAPRQASFSSVCLTSSKAASDGGRQGTDSILGGKDTVHNSGPGEPGATHSSRRSPRLHKGKENAISPTNTELNSSFQSSFDFDDDVLLAVEQAEADFNKLHERRQTFKEPDSISSNPQTSIKGQDHQSTLAAPSRNLMNSYSTVQSNSSAVPPKHNSAVQYAVKDIPDRTKEISTVQKEERDPKQIQVDLKKHVSSSTTYSFSRSTAEANSIPCNQGENERLIVCDKSDQGSSRVKDNVRDKSSSSGASAMARSSSSSRETSGQGNLLTMAKGDTTGSSSAARTSTFLESFLTAEPRSSNEREKAQVATTHIFCEDSQSQGVEQEVMNHVTVGKEQSCMSRVTAAATSSAGRVSKMDRRSHSTTINGENYTKQHNSQGFETEHLTHQPKPVKAPCKSTITPVHTKKRILPTPRSTISTTPHLTQKRTPYPSTQRGASPRSPVSPPPLTSPLQDRLLLSSWGLPDAVLQQYHQAHITQMFPWQADCLGTGRVLEGGNLVYAAPTSAGKTLVAELLVLKKVLETKKKALIILPFVSVSREKMFYLQSMFSEVGVRVDGFMGSHSPPGGLASTDIAVCTIEKANSLVNRLLEEKTLGQLGIVVVDELHMIGDSHRGYLLELLLTKIRFAMATSNKPTDLNLSSNNNLIQIVGMSATLPNLDLLAQWLDADLYRTDYRPVPLSEYVKIGKTLYDSSMKKIREIESRLNVADEDQVYSLCLETISQGNGVLVFCPTKNWCEKLCESMAREIYKMHQGHGPTTTSTGFVKASDLVSVKLDHKSLRDVMEQLRRTPVGINSVLRKTIPYGVAFHHAGLTFDERDIIEGSFRQGFLKILVATSTLSSGVNLPARRVIIRSVMFNRKVIDPLTYKQMIGRAGRKGVDTAGESILVCKTSESEKATKLLKSELPPVQSCLVKRQGDDLSNSLKRAILEIIASGVASSPTEVQAYASSTLLAASLSDATTEDDRSKVTTESAVLSCVKFLEENEFVRLQNVETEGGPVKKYCPTQLGKATLASALSPDEALLVFAELQKARKNFVLENELHILYQVTPIYDQGFEPDWYQFVCTWEGMSSDKRRVAELVGVEEAFLMRASQGLVTYGSRSARLRKSVAVHRRFYTTLILSELVNEVPLPVVAAKYGCATGQLQSLQQSASTFAGMVTVFCHRLGWWNLELLLAQFQSRLNFGVQRELCDLVRISLLNAQRARLLYDKGYPTVAAVAACDPMDVETLLRNSVPFRSGRQALGEDAYEALERKQTRCIWATGRKGLTEAEAARQIVLEARQIVQAELGITDVAWQKEEEGEISQVAQLGDQEKGQVNGKPLDPDGKHVGNTENGQATGSENLERQNKEIRQNLIQEDETIGNKKIGAEPGQMDEKQGMIQNRQNLGVIEKERCSEEQSKADSRPVQQLIGYKKEADKRKQPNLADPLPENDFGKGLSADNQTTRNRTEDRVLCKTVNDSRKKGRLHIIQIHNGNEQKSAETIRHDGQTTSSRDESLPREDSPSTVCGEGIPGKKRVATLNSHDASQKGVLRTAGKSQIVTAMVHAQPSRDNFKDRPPELSSAKLPGNDKSSVPSRIVSRAPEVTGNIEQQDCRHKHLSVCDKSRNKDNKKHADEELGRSCHAKITSDAQNKNCMKQNMTSTPAAAGDEIEPDLIVKEKNTSPDLFSCPLNESEFDKALELMETEQDNLSPQGDGQIVGPSPQHGECDLNKTSPNFPDMDSQLEQYMADYCTQNDMVAESASPELVSRKSSRIQQGNVQYIEEACSDATVRPTEVHVIQQDFHPDREAVQSHASELQRPQTGLEEQVDSTQDMLLAAAMCESFDSFSSCLHPSPAPRHSEQETAQHTKIVNHKSANDIEFAPEIVQPTGNKKESTSENLSNQTEKVVEDGSVGVRSKSSFNFVEIPLNYETLDPNFENATVIFVGDPNKLPKEFTSKSKTASAPVNDYAQRSKASTREEMMNGCTNRSCENAGQQGKQRVNAERPLQSDDGFSEQSMKYPPGRKDVCEIRKADTRTLPSTSRDGGSLSECSAVSKASRTNVQISDQRKDTTHRDESSLLSPGTVAMLDFFAGEDDMDMFTQLKETPESMRKKRMVLAGKNPNENACSTHRTCTLSKDTPQTPICGRKLNITGKETICGNNRRNGEEDSKNMRYCFQSRSSGSKCNNHLKKRRSGSADYKVPTKRQKTPPKDNVTVKETNTIRGRTECGGKQIVDDESEIGADHQARRTSESGDFIPPTPPKPNQGTPRMLRATGTQRSSARKSVNSTAKQTGKKKTSTKSSKTPKRTSPSSSSSLSRSRQKLQDIFKKQASGIHEVIDISDDDDDDDDDDDKINKEKEIQLGNTEEVRQAADAQLHDYRVKVNGFSAALTTRVQPEKGKSTNLRVTLPAASVLVPTIDSEMLQQDSQDLFSPGAGNTHNDLNMAMDEYELDLDLKLSIDSDVDMMTVPSANPTGLQNQNQDLELESLVPNRDHRLGPTVQNDDQTMMSTFASSFSCPQSFSSSPAIPSSDGAFAIIDVCGNLDLFNTFIAEWKRKQRYAVSIACEKYQAPVQGGGIGGNFRRPGSTAKKTPGSKPDGFLVESLGLLVTGVAVCWGGKDAYFISLQNQITENDLDDTLAPPVNAPNLPVTERLRKMKPVLEIDKLGRTAKSKMQHKVVFGAKLQYKILSQACGCLLAGALEDPKVAKWLIDPGSKEPNLHSLVTQYSPSDAHLIECLGGGVGLRGPGANTEMNGSGRLRATTEAVLCLQVMDCLKEKLEEQQLWQTFIQIEMPSIVTLARVELNGIGLDGAECETQKSIMQAKLRSLEEEAYKMAGHTFSLTSPDDVAQVLYVELKLPPNGDTTSTAPARRTLGARGRPRLPKHFSTSKESLEKLKPLHSLPAIILEFRRISAAVAKVVFPLQKEKVHHGRLEMDRIYTVYQTHTATGRVATFEPNIQAIPKEFEIDMPSIIEESPPTGGGAGHAIIGPGMTSNRKGKKGRMMRAGGYAPLTITGCSAPCKPGPKFAVSIRHAFCPFKGGVMLAADYSQLELRLLAHLAQDKALIHILNSGSDVFRQIAAKWRNIDIGDVTSEQRQQAKQMCYGMIYGIGCKALGEQLGVCEEDAAAFMESFKDQYTGMKTYVVTVVKQCREKGYVQTLTGRRRYLPSIHHATAGVRNQAERQAINTTVQGSAADLVKTAMVKIDQRLAVEYPNTRRTHSHKEEETLGNMPNRRKSRRLQQSASTALTPSGAFLVLQLHDELIYEVRREDADQVAELIKAEMEGAMKLSVMLPVKVKMGPTWGTLEDIDL